MIDRTPCRYLLLAHEHGHAAAKAVNSMQPLLADLQQQLLRCAASNSSNAGSRSAGTSGGGIAPTLSTSTPQQLQQLLSCSAVQQLVHWHTYLESLDVAELPPPCWHDVFAHLLLTGALRAFGFRYQQVSLPGPAGCSHLSHLVVMDRWLCCVLALLWTGVTNVQPCLCLQL